MFKKLWKKINDWRWKAYRDKEANPQGHTIDGVFITQDMLLHRVDPYTGVITMTIVTEVTDSVFRLYKCTGDRHWTFSSPFAFADLEKAKTYSRKVKEGNPSR